jgi:hypothetical protein
MKMYLYEGLNKQDRASMRLWESAGHAIVEAQLTADQIQQLFQQIDQAKGNRTAIGKGVDAGSAVMKAYADLKTKVANSGPVKNVDAMYDQAAEKLKQATGGDQGVMQYVQKYRDFAKKHPIAQSLIYGALIAAAGISGVGAGGAAALGLFKMVDKLLQGEKFSSAAYSGAKTGAMAYAAGQIGKAMKGGDQAQQATGALPANADWQDYEAAVQNFNPKLADYVQDYLNDMNNSDEWKTEFMKNIYRYGDKERGATMMRVFVDAQARLASASVAQTTQAALNAAGNPTFESRNLSHRQVLALFERVEHINNRMLTEGRLEEGIWDDIKSGAGKGLQGIKNVAGKALGAVAQGAAKVGHSMTTKVTGSALQKAWEKAGKPTDSAEIEKFLQTQGVNPEVIKTVFQANKIPVTPTAPVGQDAANDPTVDAANEPMPDVMTPGGNRPEQGAMAQGVQQAQGGQQQPQQAQGGQQQPAQQQPQQAQGGQPQPQQAQGGQPQAQQPQPAQGGQQQPVAGVSKLPDVSKLTPEQKKQLLAQVEERLKSLPAPTQQPQPQPQAEKPAPPSSPAPTNDAEARQKARDDAITNAVNAEPEQPADLFAEPAATPDLKVSPAPKAGMPTPAEQAKYQEKLKAADQTQNKTTTVGAPTPDEQAKLQAKLKAADQAQNKTKPAPKELAESYKEFKFLVDGIKARI